MTTDTNTNPEATDVLQNENRRYEVVPGDTIQTPYGTTLTRIRALIDMPYHEVTAGDLGGYIEKETNLPHELNGWVFGDARVSEEAVVRDFAQVKDSANVSGRAMVCGSAVIKDRATVTVNAVVGGAAFVYEDARISGNAEVIGNAKVFGHALVRESASVSGRARVFDFARIRERASVEGSACIYGNAIVSGRAKISDQVKVYGDSVVGGNCVLYESASVYGDAVVEDHAEVDGFSKIFGNARITGRARIGGNATISRYKDYMHFGPFTDLNLWLTAHRDLQYGVRVAYGDFTSSLDGLEAHLSRQKGFDPATLLNIATFLDAVRQTFSVLQEKNVSQLNDKRAFPTLETDLDGNLNPADAGMSLRDWFAGQSLSGLCAFFPNSSASDIANWAYEIADVMMQRRDAVKTEYAHVEKEGVQKMDTIDT